ncbi:MAG: hypothetical protein ACRDR6_21700 [Pseudonocardiaceae bacterium]
MGYCTSCGSPLQPGGSFCTGCGEPVSAAQRPVPAPPGVPDGWGIGSSTRPRPTGRLVAGLVTLVLLVSGAAAWATVGPGFGRRTAPMATPPHKPATVQLTHDPASPPSTTSDPFPTSSSTPDPSTVTLTSDAAAHPEAEQVRALLQRYFDAINSHDYDAWTSTVTSSRVNDIPRTTWLQGYSTTKDDSIVVTGIHSDGPQSVTVRLSFASSQDPGNAPADLKVGRICWSTELPISDLDNGGQVGKATTGSTSRSAC